MIRAIIIEDEINSQELLKSILEKHHDNIKVEGITDGVESGIELIKELKPDVIFLDVEIQGGTGFDLLNAFTNPEFKVIFVTGYDHYALKAIKYAALDYVLKPINLEEIKRAINRITLLKSSQQDNISFLQENISKAPEEMDQLIISDEKSHTIVKFENILFVKADRTYVSFFLENAKQLMVSNTLHFYESLLPTSVFYRTHKSYLVNIKKVLKVGIGRGGCVKLKEGFELPIAYRRKTAFLKTLRESENPK